MPDEVNVYLWRDGFHLFFPMRGKDHWRIVGILPPELRGRDDVDIRRRDAVAAQARRAPDLSFKSCTWFSTYRIHHRGAARFRDRRCFLLGDAAHIHSPVGAQGMNTGLQDAYNLAWKLALVVAGQADAGAARFLRGTSASRSRSDCWRRPTARSGWSSPTAGSPACCARKVLARIAAFAMTLRAGAEDRVPHRLADRHSLSRRAAVAIAARICPRARRAPATASPGCGSSSRANGPVEDLFQALDDTHFNLIVIGQPAPASAAIGFGELCRVHAVPDDPANDAELARAQIPQPSFYLLRPDGHVGLCGAGLEAAAVKRYLSEHLHMKA